MYRTITYRLYPTAGQRGALVRLLRSQSALYNAALEERRGRWAWNGERVGWIDQFKGLTGASTEIPSLDEFGVTVHRGTLKRLDQAFEGFFRRVSAGQTPGYPRFRSPARFDSVTYPTTDDWKLYVPEGRKGTYGRLRIRGVGHVQTKLHRSFDGAAAKAGLNRSILDAGWGQLASMVAYKAEEAGRRLVFVEPRYTSQTCAQCGYSHRDNRKSTAFCCQGCGHEDHADLNAATNILRLAGQELRPGSGHARLTA